MYLPNHHKTEADLGLRDSPVLSKAPGFSRLAVAQPNIGATPFRPPAVALTLSCVQAIYGLDTGARALLRSGP